MSKIVEESPGFLQIFSDGSIKRFIPQTISASPQQSTEGFKSKDVTIDPSKPITGRLFIPDDQVEPLAKSNLPALVYFHGGGFCIGSTTWLGYHQFLGDLSAMSKCLILSVDYRLAPEHRLPAAYDDCYASLKWLSHQLEPWLQTHADLSRVFLAGDSAGGNIVHNVIIKTLRQPISGLEIKGILLIHPYFGSERRTVAETGSESEAVAAVKSNDMFWRLSLPEGLNRDYPGCNYESQDDDIAWDDFPETVVYVAGKDFLKERGVMYADFLRKKLGLRVKLVEEVNEGHVFHVFEPKKEATRLMRERISEFFKSF